MRECPRTNQAYEVRRTMKGMAAESERLKARVQVNGQPL